MAFFKTTLRLTRNWPDLVFFRPWNCLLYQCSNCSSKEVPVRTLIIKLLKLLHREIRHNPCYKDGHILEFKERGVFKGEGQYVANPSSFQLEPPGTRKRSATEKTTIKNFRPAYQSMALIHIYGFFSRQRFLLPENDPRCPFDLTFSTHDRINKKKICFLKTAVA